MDQFRNVEVSPWNHDSRAIVTDMFPNEVFFLRVCWDLPISLSSSVCTEDSMSIFEGYLFVLHWIIMDYLQAYAYAVLLFNSSMDDKVSLQLARKVATLILTKSRTKFW